ncbi:scavenger receptor cysteine-rich type 1 protein M130-like [Mustelus asterias]
MEFRSIQTLFLLQLLNCKHGNSQSGPSENLQLRLSDGGSRCAGRVEVLYRGEWGSVCNDDWEDSDAAVVCRQLGCGNSLDEGLISSGAGSGPIWLDDVQCSGEEPFLWNCSANPWGQHDCGHDEDVKVMCSDHIIPRLQSGFSKCLGILEINKGATWERVCDLHWDWNDAQVVCAHLHCGVALPTPAHTYFGEGTGRRRSHSFECKGNETNLNDCPLSPVNHHECSHGNDVAVACSGNNGPRLVGGEDRCSGRVEVLHGEHWGTLCDVYFDLEDANVVCQHLQCGTVETILRNAHFGNGTGPIWKENYRCRGNESRLEDCPLSSGEKFNCSHLNDAGVICSDAIFSLRVSNGGSRCDGRVEIYYNHSWGRVQDSQWDMNDANVTCRQLGCGAAVAAYNNSKYGEGEGPVWVNDVQCEGNESHLWNCSTFTMNPHRSDNIGVGVLCSEHKELRLVNGNHRCEGRVEVFYNGAWGTVCSENLDRHDAEVICKQLQCGVQVSIDDRAHQFGEGSDPIWLDEIECGSHESTIWQCLSDPWGQHNCHHWEDAGVVCSKPKATEVERYSSRQCSGQADSGLSLHLVGGNTKCSGRVEVLCNNTWGMVCDDSWDIADANVVCRQLNCGPALLASGGAMFGMSNTAVWLDEVKCTGSESILSDCTSASSTQPDCNHKEAANVICSELPQTPSSTPAGQEAKTTNVPVVICITLGIMLICALIALLLVLRKNSKRKGASSGHWGSPIGLYQTIYEEIDNISRREDSIYTHRSVPASIDSLNQVVYYTRNRLSDTDPASENPQGDPCSAHGLDDDVETGSIDSQRRHMLLDCTADDHSMLTIGGANVSTLGKIEHQHQEAPSSDI